MVDIKEARKFLDECMSEFKYCERKNEELEDLLKREKRKTEAIKIVRATVQTAAQEVQKNLEYHLSDLVTTALHAIFPDDINFIAKIEQRRGQTECDLLFEEKDNKYKPLDGSGYGPVDVATFVFRLCFWSLKKNRPTFILDEPFRNLSPNFHSKISELIKELSEELGIQFIIVSHQDEINIAADRTFYVDKVDDKSMVKTL